MYQVMMDTILLIVYGCNDYFFCEDEYMMDHETQIWCA